MNQRVYIDESKARNYLMVAAAVIPADARGLRKVVRSLILPGQRRLHMNDERDSRRRLILAALAGEGVKATIYDAGGAERSQRNRRTACLDAIVVDAKASRHGHLILDLDESLVRSDRVSIIGVSQRIGYTELTYEHAKSTQDLLLAIPDAVAWAWAKGGDWRRRLGPIVEEIKAV